MARDKFNMIEELAEKDAELTKDISLLGASALTRPDYVNPMRGTMFTSHIKQAVPLENPEYPFYGTNAENTVGKHSSGYKECKHDEVVFRKIMKFDDILDKPMYGLVFLIDKKRKKIRVVERKEVENLTEIYGFHYNNEVIDSLQEGDLVEKGTVLYKSRSYDEYMNYAYGMNVRYLYTLDAETTEDALVISESLAEKMKSPEIKTIKIPVNDNHYLLNLYGDDEHYVPLPALGQRVKNGIITAKRTLINNQILTDFTSDALRRINYASDELHHGDGIVIDIDVFSNNEDLRRTSFNSQLIDIYESEMRYYQRVMDACEEIYRMRDEEGYEINKKINFWYSKARNFTRQDYKWKEGEGVFSNMVLQITTMNIVTSQLGQKFTGRSGNKSVVSEIRPDCLMPVREDGVHFECMGSILGICNRTTAFPLYEEGITFILERTREYARTLPTYLKKKLFIFDIIKMLNEREYETFEQKYSELSKKEREEFIDSCIEDGIYIYHTPFDEGEPLFFRIKNILEKYRDIMKPYDVYVYKFGRWIKAFAPVYAGTQYIMKLKQTSKKGFIARNTGEINMEGLPEKSHAHKNGTAEMSENTVRFGEFETYEFKVAMPSSELAEFYALYRTSVKGRRDLAASLLQDEGRFEFHHSYTSRVNEIFAVFLKSLGVEITFRDGCSTLNEYDDSEIKEFHIDRDTYLCTEWEFYKEEMRHNIRNEILKEVGIMDETELENEVELRLVDRMSKTIG